MNKLILAGLIAGFGDVGCNKSSDTGSLPMDSGVTEIAPSPPGGYGSTPAPQPQPVVYDTMNTTPGPGGNTYGSTGNTAPMVGGSYTIRQGDTLFSIAKSRYNDGKQWSRIVQANPGLTPEKLRVGQTITLP